MLRSLWKKLRGSEEKESLPENRRFHRVAVAESGIFELELPGETIHLRDISFGGIGIPIPQIKENQFSAVLRVLDQSFRCNLSQTHRADRHVGYLFEAGNDSVLVFLQPIMNALHQGVSLRTIDPSVLKEEAQQRYAYVMRGEGPTDILIESATDSTLNCLMTLRKDKVYHQLSWRDGTIATARILDDRGVSPRMNPDKEPDPQALKQAMLILAGGLSHEELKKPLKPLLASLRSLYGNR